ncbi:MAG: RraA family protein [Gaiellales bacterium]
METAELCERYRALYVPVVCDTLYELGHPEQVLPSALRPLFPERRLAGIAHTVEGAAIEPHIGWNDGIARIMPYLGVFERLAPDSILVSVNPASHVGHFGELTANAARARGCVGCLLDGNLRDVEGLRDIGFQVFYRDLSPLNAIGRWEMVAEQAPVEIGGVAIAPGDVILAEFDGVLVIPSAQAEQVLLRAEEIVAAEGRVRREVAAGTSPVESFDRHGHI